ncbi:hypothetical protein B0H12DRAFT_1242966 [Mycena haematopus]|nr:hypothetical protein B0H12DRAFT_1242966 [Mycena haematopus]
MADLTRNTAGMPHHPDTPAGRAAYQQQVVAWKAANPAKFNGGDEFVPYLLMPGTNAVGTGECFDCGVRHPRNTAHPRPAVDAGETYYHRVANRIIREDRQATDVANAAAGKESGNAAKPFICKVQLVGVNGGLIWMEATFDDGALLNAIDTVTFINARGRLSELIPSRRVLRMANGALVPSIGTWRGTVVVGGVSAVGQFEIFPGSGVWQMLLGKPMLHAFSASHEYVNDTVTLRTTSGMVVLQNDMLSVTEGPCQNKVAIAHVKPIPGSGFDEGD